MLFKYERLPNFCYRCGLLEHALKDCTRKDEVDKNGERGGALIRCMVERGTGEENRMGINLPEKE